MNDEKEKLWMLILSFRESRLRLRISPASLFVRDIMREENGATGTGFGLIELEYVPLDGFELEYVPFSISWPKNADNDGSMMREPLLSLSRKIEYRG